MKRENIFFLAGLFFLFLLFFIVNLCSNDVLNKTSDLFLLKQTDVSLLRPLSKEQITDLYLNSNNFLSAFVDLDEQKEIILAEKKSSDVIPIASLTKLMSAVVSLENYSLDDVVVISSSAVSTTGTMGDLRANEKITVNDLMYVTLIESSNDGAEALAEKMGRTEFIYKMNKKATELGMENTRFYNPTGLDIFTNDSATELLETNVSTVEDLEKLVIYILNNHTLIPQILSLSEKKIVSESGVVHNLKNTNILLKENTGYLWGKTGYTKEANGCIILILNNYSSVNSGYIINVITGADDRFKEARKLEEWLQASFIW
ncbi:MAG: serine hydrolase [Candidatus Paceibacterota bacterium]|jgi:D-alanyl-D-alanine carboxypeptidase